VKHIIQTNRHTKKRIEKKWGRQKYRKDEAKQQKQSFSDSLRRIVAPTQLLCLVTFFLVWRDGRVVLKASSSANRKEAVEAHSHSKKLLSLLYVLRTRMWEFSGKFLKNITTFNNYRKCCNFRSHKITMIFFNPWGLDSKFYVTFKSAINP